MSTPKGYSTGSKLDRLTSQFATVEPIKLEQYGLSVLAHTYMYVVGTDAVDSATTYVITAAAHAAQKGDVIHFTSGTFADREVRVDSVTTDTITLVETLASAPANAVTFQILRHRSAIVDSSGSVIANVTLPAGSATAAKQDTGNASLGSIDGKITAVNTGAVVVASSALPSGAATEATLLAASAKLPATLGQKAMAASMAVVLASDQSSITVNQGTQGVGAWPVLAAQSGSWNIVNISGTITLPTGAATEAKQDTGNTSVASIDTKTPALGQALAAASVPVVLTAAQLSTLTPLATIAATQSGTWTVQPGNTPNTTAWLVRQAGKTSANAPARNDYSSVNVTTSAYVQLVASTTSLTTEIEIFDSSGQTLALAVGAPASEVIQCYIFPGGNGRIPLAIPASSRVSIKAVSATASSGEVDINFWS